MARQIVQKGETEHEQKSRDVILTQPRRAVLVQILTSEVIPGMGLAKRDYNEEVINEKRIVEAKKLSLDPMAYMRGQPDTGTQVENGKNGVRVSLLLGQLHEKGLRYVGGWWHTNAKDKEVYNLLFSVDFPVGGEEVPLPEKAKEILARRFGSCVVWANPRTHKETNKRIRTDSIVLNNPSAKQDALADELLIVGNTYRLV